MAPFGIRVLQAKVNKFEIQADIQSVSLHAARLASMELVAPAVVDDSGLFVDALGGFPGPYSSYVQQTIGISGVLRLMKEAGDRRAAFKCAVGYADVTRGLEAVFLGEAKGYVRTRPAGKGGFGFDPIFSPFGISGKSFAEMSDEEKSRLSHRGMAFRKLANFLDGMQGERR